MRFLSGSPGFSKIARLSKDFQETENDYAPYGPSKMRDFGESIIICSLYLPLFVSCIDSRLHFFKSMSVKAVI